MKLLFEADHAVSLSKPNDFTVATLQASLIEYSNPARISAELLPMLQTHEDILNKKPQEFSVVCLSVENLADLMYRVANYRPDEFMQAVKLFNEKVING
jgi:hypothetical protein